jgi:hypothetical protein
MYKCKYVFVFTYTEKEKKEKKEKKESSLIMPTKKIEEVIKPNFIKKRKKVDVEKDEKRTKIEVYFILFTCLFSLRMLF